MKVCESKFEHRATVCLTDSQREAILKIRQMDEFRECSLSEIVRMLIDNGLNATGYPAKA